jgi:hypothetical protein
LRFLRGGVRAERLRFKVAARVPTLEAFRAR